MPGHTLGTSRSEYCCMCLIIRNMNIYGKTVGIRMVSEILGLKALIGPGHSNPGPPLRRGFSVFNLGNFKWGHFHLHFRNKLLSIFLIHIMLKMTLTSFIKAQWPHAPL